MTDSAPCLFDRQAIPQNASLTAFVRAVENAVYEMERSLVTEVDMTEGLGQMTISGSIECYKQIVMRRVIELVRATSLLWNSKLEVGALLAARAILETIVSFHAFLRSVDAAEKAKNYQKLEEIVDEFMLSTRVKSLINMRQLPQSTNIITYIESYAKHVEPMALEYYEQISDYCHPNGYAMLRKYGNVHELVFRVGEPGFDRDNVFSGISNAVYQTCWFYYALSELEKISDRIRYLD